MLTDNQVKWLGIVGALASIIGLALYFWPSVPNPHVSISASPIQMSRSSATATGSGSTAFNNYGSGNVSITNVKEIPTALYAHWLNKLSSSPLQPDARIKTLEALSGLYKAVQLESHNLPSKEPWVNGVQTEVARGNLLGAENMISDILSSDRIRDQEVLQQLQNISAQLRSINRFDTSDLSNITPAIMSPPPAASAQPAAPSATYFDNGSIRFDPLTGSLASSQEIDWVMGTTKGILMHFAVDGSCRETTYNQQSKLFQLNIVQCPPN